MNGLRAGFLGVVVLCRSGIRARFGVNMVNTEEFEFSRLVEEDRANLPRVETQQAKAPASNSSGIAPVNRRSFTACSR